MSSSITPTISSAGIGSGLDVNSIVSSLMAVEQQPLTKMQKAYSALQTQLSTIGQLQSAVSALHDASTPLFAADTFSLTSASSSDPASVSAGSTSAAAPGNYTVNVTTLAAAQAVVNASGQYTSSTSTVGSGSLTFRTGTWASGLTSFTPKAGSADVTIAIGAGDTLAQVRDKINGANAGVTATIVTDASGVRISMQSTASGLDNGFRVVAVDDDGDNTDSPGLSGLAYDPPNVSNQMSLATAAVNTQATINGIGVSSASGTFAGVIDGVTFNLNKITTSPVTVNITRNTDAIKTKLNAFVAAYNQLNKFLSDATKYDSSTKTAAVLQGDGTTVGIQNQLHSLLAQSSGASTPFARLSDLGVQVQKDGSLLLNDSKFAAALTNLPELSKALTNLDAGTPSNNGFAQKFAAWSDRLLSSAGAVPGKTNALKARIASNEKDQTALTDRLAIIEQRIKAQYTALDSTMANANALSKYVTQQITTWNKSTG